jgi:AhpD family alkylhydroperoxidase
MEQRLDQQAHAPEAMRALGGVWTYVDKCGLPRSLIDLVYLRVSQINGCAYCISTHSRDLLRQGVAPARLMMLSAWREAGPMFSAEERAALRWAEALTLVSETHVPDADYEAVAARFNEKERVDLTVAIGLINAFNRLGVGFRKAPEGMPAGSGAAFNADSPVRFLPGAQK